MSTPYRVSNTGGGGVKGCYIKGWLEGRYMRVDGGFVT